MNRLEYKKAVTVGAAIKNFLKLSRLSSGYNTHLIFSAWDEVSGAAGYTTNRYFRDGILYITTNSSVARMQLQTRADLLVKKINESLEKNEMFIKDDPNVGYVKSIKVK